MSELKGLDAIRAYKKKMAEQAAEREERAKNADRPKPRYLRLAVDESVKVRFLQEMDTESRNYDPNRGVGVGVIEHQGLDTNFKFRANCTMDTEGRCWACEKARVAKKDSKEKGYSARKNYYINVLVDRGDGNEPEVYVLSRGLNSSFVADLMEETDEEGSITEKTYKLTRRGTGTDSTYSIREVKNDTTFDKFDFDKVEIFDIEDQVLRKIPYETDYENRVFSQEQFYTQSPGDWKRIFANDDDEAKPAEANTQKADDAATSIEVGW
ncbi:SSB protein [Streptomyces phage Enygma]